MLETRVNGFYYVIGTDALTTKSASRMPTENVAEHEDGVGVSIIRYIPFNSII